jgi:DNA-binding MarR family transcriptional regulator
LYKELPGSKDNVEEGAIKHKFYKNLPASFRKDEITDILEKIGISVRSAERYLKSFTEAGLLVKVKRGEYRKP